MTTDLSPWSAAALFPYRPPLVLGKPLDGVVSWNVNDTCNYRCTYCTQRFMPVRSYRLDEFEGYLNSFRSLPGRWEVKLSGGEPFQQPEITRLVAGLVDAGHVVSVQTNFSASDRKLKEFLDATRGALHVFSASLHLEYASPQDFIDRFKRVVQPHTAANPGMHFNVTTVATPALIGEIATTVVPAFAEAGVVLKVQPEKVRGELQSYTSKQMKQLEALGGHNNTGVVANDFQGRLCHAGSRYLVVRSDGEVYRCYASRRHGGRYAHLGHFLNGFERQERPHICPYTYCYCTVPIHRGMIQGVPASLSEERG